MRLSLEPREDFTAEEQNRSLRWMIRDATCSQVMNTITSGTLLCAFAVALGASNTVVGLMAGVAPLFQLLQLPATALIERLRRRKLIAVTAATAARVMWLVVAALALLPAGRTRIVLLLSALGVRAALSAFYICSSNSWNRDVLPDGTMGDFYARRQRQSYVAGLVTGLVGGYLVDAARGGTLFGSHLGGYAVLFVAAFVAGEVAVLMMLQVPEPALPVRAPAPLLARLAEPFRDVNYRRFLTYLGAWNLTTGMATPLLTVLLLRHLGYPVLWVVLLEGAGKAAHLLTLGPWGRLADRHSSRSVVAAAQPLYWASLFLWPAVGWFGSRGPTTLACVALIYVVNRVAVAGISIGNMTLAMQLAPRGGATSYLTVRSLTMNPVAFVAPVVGGFLADHAAKVPALARVGGIELVLVLASLVGIGCGVLLRGVTQEGAATARAVRADFAAQLLTLVTGLGGALRARLTRGSP